MLHVWNMYLHLAHIYGKCIGKCSIHEAYADLNRPSYPRQASLQMPPEGVISDIDNLSWTVIDVIVIQWFVWLIYIYIMVWQMTWGYIERMIENSIHVVQTWIFGAQSIPYICAIAELETFEGHRNERNLDCRVCAERRRNGDCPANLRFPHRVLLHDGANSWGWLGEMYGRCCSRDLLPLLPLSSQLCLPEGNPFLFVNHEAWDNFIWSEL